MTRQCGGSSGGSHERIYIRPGGSVEETVSTLMDFLYDSLGAEEAHASIRAAVLGHLVGDAIGVPYEFTAPDASRVVELRGHGSHHQPRGTWSDDGALMLALLDSLRRVGFDPEDQGRRALAWADAKTYTPDAEGAFDIGNATAAALSRLRAGVPAIDAGGTGERDQATAA